MLAGLISLIFDFLQRRRAGRRGLSQGNPGFSRTLAGSVPGLNPLLRPPSLTSTFVRARDGRLGRLVRECVRAAAAGAGMAEVGAICLSAAGNVAADDMGTQPAPQQVQDTDTAQKVATSDLGGEEPVAVRYERGQRVDVAWVERLSSAMEKATWTGTKGTAAVLPAETLKALLQDAAKACQSQPALAEVNPPEAATVTVVGDTHGQFHDVRHMLEVAGRPSESCMYIFNGDYVDRGAWGVETLALVAAYRLALPDSVVMLRGNHESSCITMAYGFRGELTGKYGTKPSKAIFKAAEQLFAALPLGALVGPKTLVVHGGLFRQPPVKKKKSGGRGRKRRRVAVKPNAGHMQLGSLQDLRKASKGGQDPSGRGATQVAADVLWSDPVREEGLKYNDERGIGIMFGPDQTQTFLEANGLTLVLRSHEGPDARCRPNRTMPLMDAGYSLDHSVPAGRLMTIFSAPDYPQFQPVDDPEDRFNNLAAVAVLSSPYWDQPVMKQYQAVLPRPEASPFYDLGLPDSDEEYLGPEDGGASDWSEAEFSFGSAADNSPTPSTGTPRVNFPAEEDELTVRWSGSSNPGGAVVCPLADGELTTEVTYAKRLKVSDGAGHPAAGEALGSQADLMTLRPEVDSTPQASTSKTSAIRPVHAC